MWEYMAAGCREVSWPFSLILIESLLSDSAVREQGDERERERMVREGLKDNHAIGKGLFSNLMQREDR